MKPKFRIDKFNSICYTNYLAVLFLSTAKSRVFCGKRVRIQDNIL
jgi:hypothetical protein